MKNVVRFALAAVALTTSSAFAGTFADVHITNRTTGQRLPIYHSGGKLYVAGNPGDRYAVQVANRAGNRILTVVSVDGINVVSGETAAPHQTGYVLHAGQSYEINGWRKSASEIAAFYFTALPDSYAARTDRPNHVGVIGVAVFREWTPPPRPRPTPHPMPRSQTFDGSGAPAGSAMNEASKDRAEAQPDLGAADARSALAESERADRAVPAPRQRERIGTGHGEREQSHVSYTDFRRASSAPNEVLTIHYDRYENLVARGIIPGMPRYAEPQPFPGNVRFVPDPRS